MTALLYNLGGVSTLIALAMFQKQESFLKPLVDQFAKEGKDKKVVFEAIFTKPNSKPKWYFRKDVSRTWRFSSKYIYIKFMRM